MEIVGVADVVPAKKVVREKGTYHEDVIAMMEEVDNRKVTATRRNGSDPKANLWDGDFVVGQFDDAKEAQTRATTLRSAGYVAIVRGSEVYASKEAATDEDDED